MTAVEQRMEHLWRQFGLIGDVRAQCRKAHIDLDKFFLVYLVLRSDGPHHSKQLAQLAGMSATATSRALARLEERGLVEPAIDREDRRRMLYAASSLGTYLHASVENAIGDEALRHALKTYRDVVAHVPASSGLTPFRFMLLASAYLAELRGSPQTLADLTRHTGATRSRASAAVREMVQQGLACTVLSDGKRCVLATDEGKALVGAALAQLGHDDAPSDDERAATT